MKKGFTLIELLAVVVILAILAALAITIVNGTITSSAEKLYNSQVSNIIEASRSYILQNGYTSEITICDLKKANLLAKDIKNPKTEKLFDNALIITVSKDSNNNFTFEFDGSSKKSNYICEY